MEHILLKNKKGVSILEMLAYTMLYGIVMASLATLVFVIVQSARKVNAQSILNRGASLMYTEVLAQTINLNPDTVSNVTYSAYGNTASITLSKRFYYNNEGERKSIVGVEEFANKVTSITYSYVKGTSVVKTIITLGNGTVSDTSINLEGDMTITSHDSTDITDVFSVDTQNSSNKFVTFHGDLHYSKKSMEFNFIIPVFTAKDDTITGD